MSMFTLPPPPYDKRMQPREHLVIKLWLQPLGHYLVTLWRDDWNDTTCDTGLDQEELLGRGETKRKGYSNNKAG